MPKTSKPGCMKNFLSSADSAASTPSLWGCLRSALCGASLALLVKEIADGLGLEQKLSAGAIIMLRDDLADDAFRRNLDDGAFAVEGYCGPGLISRLRRAGR